MDLGGGGRLLSFPDGGRPPNPHNTPLIFTERQQKSLFDLANGGIYRDSQKHETEMILGTCNRDFRKNKSSFNQDKYMWNITVMLIKFIELFKVEFIYHSSLNCLLLQSGTSNFLH